MADKFTDCAVRGYLAQVAARRQVSAFVEGIKDLDAWPDQYGDLSLNSSSPLRSYEYSTLIGKTYFDACIAEHKTPNIPPLKNSKGEDIVIPGQ